MRRLNWEWEEGRGSCLGIRGGDGGTFWREQVEGWVGRSAVLQTDLEEVGGGGGIRGGRQWGLGEESRVEEGCNCCGGEGWGSALY